MKRATLVTAVLALLLLTACRDSDADLQADACTELVDMQQAVVVARENLSASLNCL